MTVMAMQWQWRWKSMAMQWLRYPRKNFLVLLEREWCVGQLSSRVNWIHTDDDIASFQAATANDLIQQGPLQFWAYHVLSKVSNAVSTCILLVLIFNVYLSFCICVCLVKLLPPAKAFSSRPVTCRVSVVRLSVTVDLCISEQSTVCICISITESFRCECLCPVHPEPTHAVCFTVCLLINSCAATLPAQFFYLGHRRQMVASC